MIRSNALSTQERLTGIIAATFTPMTENGDIDLDRIPGYIDHLLSRGVDGFYVCGSTGEGVSMSDEERRLVAEAFIQAVGGRKPVVVQVGHNSIREACALAAHAAAAGATAISATPPSYFKINTVAQLSDCIAEIAGAAPGIPFYYYHIPAVTGVNVDMPDFLSHAGQRIANLAGVKFTSPAIWEYQCCVELENGRFDCLYGHDEMLLPSLAVGAIGAVGSTYNIAPEIYRQILSAFDADDLQECRRLQAQANGMIRLLLRAGGLPAMKWIMGPCGYDCGPVRKPLAVLSSSQKEDLLKGVQALGILQPVEGKSPVAVPVH